MIRAGRTLLRPARNDDLDALHAIYSDPEAMRYWSDPPHPDRTRTLVTLLSLIETQDEFVVVHDGQVIGKAGLWRPFELGFIFRRDRWGLGLAFEATAGVLAECWRRHPDLDAITAETDPANAASMRLLARLGFAETHRAERTIMVADVWGDSVYFALGRPAGG